MELLEGLSQKDREQFRRICGKLLSTCFICKKNESTRADYYFILRMKETFEAYLEVLGLTLEISEAYGVVQLVSREGMGHVNLRLMDSIILLILRILYDEKKRELSLTDVVVNVGDIQDKYLSMKIRSRQIDKTAMNNGLRTLKRYGIIGLLDSDMTQEDARILIYDAILMAVRVDDIEKTADLLEKYRKGESKDETAQESETD